MLNATLAKSPGITIFGFTIYAYALIIVSGMLAAFFVISLLFRRRNMSKDLFLTFFCVGLPIAIVTTRLFYCVTDGMPIEDWFSISSIREGGLSIIGGILGGAASVVAVCYFKKVNFFRAGDCIVVGLLLAQAIGRWGNFANQEVYGGEVTSSALQCFPFAVYINKTADGSCWQTFTLTFAKWFGQTSEITGGTWHYAFFFYESFFNFVGAVLMFIVAWKNPNKPNGLLIAWYFIQYGLVRSIMEPLRDSSYILSGGGVPWSLVVSILMLIFGCGLLAFLLWQNKKKEGKFFGSANGDPYGITKSIRDAKDEKAYFDKVNMMCKIYPESYERKDENGETTKNSEQPPETEKKEDGKESEE